MPGLNLTFPNYGMSPYLLVEAGADGVLLVPVLELESAPLSHPVTKVPIVIANSTIRVYSLFIVAVTFTKSQKRTRTFFDHLFRGEMRLFRACGFVSVKWLCRRRGHDCALLSGRVQTHALRGVYPTSLCPGLPSRDTDTAPVRCTGKKNRSRFLPPFTVRS